MEARRMRQVSRADQRRVLSRRAIALCVAITAMGAGFVPSYAQEASPLRLELNRLEPQGEACRTYLLIENGSDQAYRSLKLDLFAFDTDGVIAKRVALEAGPLPAKKTSVKLFDFAGLPCERMGQVLLNDVLACEAGEGAGGDCLARVRTGSKVARVGFVK